MSVRAGDDRVIARGEPLERLGVYLPMTRLRLDGAMVLRDDRWPTAADEGSVVLLPGGEAGLLRSWWNDADGTEWRWTLELSNHR